MESEAAYFAWTNGEQVVKSILAKAKSDKRGLTQDEREEVIYHTDRSNRGRRRYFVLLASE